MSLEVGAQLGEYRILSRIGGGTFGDVFDAEHVITRRRDAIKVLVDGLLHIPEEEQRFLREIQVQASLHHPNIAAVYNAFRTPHGLALVMELVRGEPLSAILARGRIPLHLGIGLVLGMLEGLSYAHTRGVIHSDIKPENIIVGHDGSVKLTDFGLARALGTPSLTEAGTFAGSPAYMSPEQGLDTSAVNARSDTYSAGVVLYEIVTGRLPFTGETAYAVMSEHQSCPPPPPIELDPTIGPELNRVILKSLEKQPDQRFQTADAFHTALEQAVAPAAPIHGTRSAVQRLSGRILLVGAASSILASAAFYSVVRHRQIVQAAVQIQTQTHPQIQPPIQIQPAPGPSQSVAPPVAPREAPVAPPSAEPVQAAQASDPTPAMPAGKQPGRVRRSAPPAPASLRITGSLPDGPDLPVRSHPRPPEHPAPSVTLAPAPPVRETPAVPVAKTPVTAAPETSAPAVKASGDSPETKTDSVDASPVKRRNVVVRTLQRVFHPHAKSGT